MDDPVKIYWCLNPIRIGKKRKLDIMNDKMDLFAIFKKDNRIPGIYDGR